MVHYGSQKEITHCSTVHPRYDTRIFYKMCVTLSKYYKVNLIIADGQGNDIKNNINIIDFGYSSTRFFRILSSIFVVPFKLLHHKTELYHLHDPELIPAGLILKLFGKKVIYDIHESYSEEILNKYWINKHLRKIISNLYKSIENIATYHFDLNICATTYINSKIKWNSVTINNYPIINLNLQKKNSQSIDFFLFVGAISINRGIIEMLQASIRCNINLIICGTFENQYTKDLFLSYKSSNIQYLGQVDNIKANELMQSAKAGFLLYHPGPNHDNSLPNKLFEYMSNSLPIICTNLPLWFNIVELNNCGICVNPFDNISLDNAINCINNNKIQREIFAKNCSKQIKNFTWLTESKKLVYEYKTLIKND